MNKKKFLNDLEKKLNILEESERKDIINEYRDIIDEKIKHGKSEEESIAEFGNLDSLVEEILKAYKINTKYKSTDEKIKEAANKGEDFIKKAAKGLSEVTKDLSNEIKNSDLEITTEKVFEIVIKILILLVGLSFLRLPFLLIEEIGKSIFTTSFFPFSFLPHIFAFIVWIFYIVCCILITIVTFKDILFIKEKSEVKKEEKKEVKEKTTKKEVKVEEKNEIRDEVIKEKTTNALMIILQIFLIFTFFIPVIAFLSGWSIALAVAIYLLVKGINTVGLIVLILGVFSITGFFIDLVMGLFSKKKKLNFISLILGFIMFIVGSLFTIEMAFNVKYVDDLPNGFEESKKTFMYSDINTLEIDPDYMRYEFIVSEEFMDNKVAVEVSYYNEFIKIEAVEKTSKLEFNIVDQDEDVAKIIKSFVNELKDDKVYNYTTLFTPRIKIYANKNTIDKIEVENN